MHGKCLPYSIIQSLQLNINVTIIDTTFCGFNALAIHMAIKDYVSNMGLESGYNSEKEYCISYANKNKRNCGYIDVVWNRPDHKIAFEIDSSVRMKSLNKLLQSNADEKIWIYCNTENFKKYISENKAKLDTLTLVPILPYRILSRVIKNSHVIERK